MNDRDPELDEILEPLRQKEPHEFQKMRWKKEISSRLKRKATLRWLPLVASLFIGFQLGAIYVRSFEAQKKETKNFVASATKVERFVNIE